MNKVEPVEENQVAWVADADTLLAEIDSTYQPVDKLREETKRPELSYYQKRVFGGLALNGRFQ